MKKPWTEQVIVRGYDVDGDTKAIKIEPNTDGMKTIDAEHTKIWEGYAFKMAHIDFTVTSSESLSILVSVPSTVQYMHIFHDVFRVSGGPFTTYIYEGATISLTGSAKATHNINRLSSITAKVVISHDPVVTNFGTELDEDYIPSDRSTPGENSGYVEHFVFKPGNHIFKALNRSVLSQEVIFRMSWFEKWV